MVLVAVGGYAAYLIVILGRAGSTPLPEVSYVPPLLWTIGGGIVAAIVLNIAVAIFSPDGVGKTDQRDREIGRFGEYAGNSLVVIGGLAALVMAMAELDHFWIANAIYLVFVVQAVAGTVIKLIAYRRGF